MPTFKSRYEPTTGRRGRTTRLWRGSLRKEPRSRRKRNGIAEIESTTLFTIFLLKPLNPSSGIQKFLFPGEEGMAVGADLHMDLLLSTLRLKRCSAGTFDHRIKNFRMNILFHLLCLQIYLTDFPQIFNFFFHSPKNPEAPLSRMGGSPTKRPESINPKQTI